MKKSKARDLFRKIRTKYPTLPFGDANYFLFEQTDWILNEFLDTLEMTGLKWEPEEGESEAGLDLAEMYPPSGEVYRGELIEWRNSGWFVGHRRFSSRYEARAAIDEALDLAASASEDWMKGRLDSIMEKFDEKAV